MVRMRVQYGCLTQEHCYFITLTIRASEGEIRSAVSVRRVWEQLLRRLKDRNPTLNWIKVIEITKKGTPHLHLVVSGIGNRKDRCDDYPKYSAAYIKKSCGEDCLLHEWGKIWYEKTGAFVIDVRKVHSSEGMAFYLAKYLSKQLPSRAVLQDLGFTRRWSRSRNWPSPKPVQLRGSRDGAWEMVEIIPRWFRRAEMEGVEARFKNSVLLDRVGDDLVLLLDARKARKVGFKFIEKVRAMREPIRRDNESKAV